MFTYIIKPQQISLQTIRNEIAKALNTALHNIKRFEFWPHQLWVHIEGVGGRLVSYRSLPTYMYQAFLAVKNCRTLHQLWELGQLFKLETKRLSRYYYDEDDNANEYLEKLRSAWAYKRDNLRIKERLEEAMKQHQKDAQQLLNSWQTILSHCDTIDDLKSLYPLLEEQSKQFEDLAGVTEQFFELYEQRRKRIKFENEPF